MRAGISSTFFSQREGLQIPDEGAFMLAVETYLDQLQAWPPSGRHILAQFDDESIVVYQAYRPSIGQWAVQHGQLGGPDFSYSRMSWIKPNFLWMMYRSGWGTKEGQEVTLALRLRRSFFDELLEQAVESTFAAAGYASNESWAAAVARSTVRLQWDPDHDPHGHRQERRAIQLGVRGNMLKRMGTESLLDVQDISALVSEQRRRLAVGLDQLELPRERVYAPATADVRRRLGITNDPP